MLKSIKLVEKTRTSRLNKELQRVNESEKADLLNTFHPDYNQNAFTTLSVGVNKGDKVPNELAKLLQGNSLVADLNIDLTHIDIDVDCLVIGGGGAGASACIEAKKNGANVLMVTKLRIGDSNTMMAEGGIQGVDKPNDSPAIHFLDVMGGSRYTSKPDLLKTLVNNGAEALSWLENLGVLFDKDENGNMITTHGGGTSRKRMHACKDTTGMEIMRVLRDEVLNLQIPILDFTSAIELIKDSDGKIAGAVLQNMETGEILIAKAKTVILATGGAGRLHYQGFPTSNHYGATADGLALGYRVGAELVYCNSLQYHPTGALFPNQIYGALVTEKVRSVGAQLVNKNGEAFMNPLETRDIATSLIIRECTQNNNGVKTPDGYGIWLDTPLIEMVGGEGTIEKRIPNMLRMYQKFGIDIRKEPILIYPTLHYQNGGILIKPTGETNIKNLYVAGELAGGIHGRNRLMGNSLLDCIVFGRICGQNASKNLEKITVKDLTLNHIKLFNEEIKKSGYKDGESSPKLLPNYARKVK
ncbi:MAG: FAD-binding protein [Clostridia bacterium]|nr:FAD-binding protein [Clostridia bacterium]